MLTCSSEQAPSLICLKTIGETSLADPVACRTGQACSGAMLVFGGCCGSAGVPLPKPCAVTDCVWRPREALKLVKGGLLFLSLAAADGDSIRSLLPLTKSFSRHLRCSVQAVVRALSSRLSPSPSNCTSSILSRLSQGLTQPHITGPFRDPTGMQISICSEETSILGAERTQILKY